MLADLKVRQALLKAVNRREMADLVTGPAGRPAGSILGSATFGYHDFSKTYLAYDPKGAGDLLETAGWIKGAGQYRTRDGKPLVITMVWDDGNSSEDRATLIKDQFARVGINLVLTYRKLSQASLEYGQGRYDLWYQNGTRADPDVLRKTYSNAGAALDGRVRYKRSSEITGSEELEQLLQKSNAIPDSPQRAAVLLRIQEILLQYAFRIPVEDNAQVVYATAKNVQGVRFSPLGEAVFYDVWKGA